MTDPFLPNSWSEFERDVYSDMHEKIGGGDDGVLQSLFHEGWFNHDIDSEMRSNFRDVMYQYMEDVYGLDFDAVFDWDAWREQYE